MSSPIPSFFKMRLIIAVALVFFGFFFIGLLHRAFAEDCPTCIDCTICIGDAYSSIGYTTHFYDTTDEAHDASGGSCYFTPDPPGPVGDPFHDCEPFYYCVSGSNRYIHCTDSDPCADVSPSPVDACYSESNINWTDQATCQYSGCKCPDYTGQENYDFETCNGAVNPSCPDTDGDGTFDSCDDCPTDPDI
ncbi:MAG: hypothetical protein D3914_00695, partial [Candidatus Electrothrix sp. LOE2]|nr:hypothetical protein [Candidatus Electrothrix sp. LOE2]